MSAFAFLGAGRVRGLARRHRSPAARRPRRPRAGARDGLGARGRRRLRGLGRARVSRTTAASAWTVDGARRCARRRTPHDPAVVGQLDDAALVFFSGGNPAYLASVLAARRSGDAPRSGSTDGSTAYAGCSAGVACLTDPTFDSDTEDPERVWAPGLGYFPRCSSRRTGTSSTPGSPARRRSSRGRARGGSLVAIDEHTAMVGDGAAWDVVGAGGVHVLPRRRLGRGARRRHVVRACRWRRPRRTPRGG